jgi:hypothetical protein
MRRAVPLIVVAFVTTVSSTSSLSAQSAHRFSIQGSLLYVDVSGDAYEGIKNGGGAEGQVRFTPGAFSIGAGYQYSSHSTDADIDVSIAGVFVEPRFVIDVGNAAFAPYASVRLAWPRAKATAFDQDVSISATQINGGGGLLFRLSPRVNLDAGLTIGRIKFKDAGSGTNVVLRTGVAIGLGQ